MLRVLQVIEPGCDGVFRHVEQLIEFLWASGISVDLAYSSRRPSAGLQILVARVHAKGGEAINLDIGPRPEIRDLSAAIRLISLFRRCRPAVVHAHSSKAGGLVRCLQPFFRKASIFYTPHAYYGMDGRRGISVRFFNLVERLLASAATTIHVSRDEADFAQRVLRVSRRREVIIANPVDCKKFKPASLSEKTEARLFFALPPDRYVIGYASRYTAQKDPDCAYQAFAKLAAIRPDVHLLHLCKFSLLEEARAFVTREGLQDRVTFVDYLEDVRPFYQALDLFLLTSRYEAGWPFVLLEALACDLAAASTICPGLSDIITAGLSHCHTFPVGSIEGCSAAMSLAHSARGESSINHRAIAETRFSVDHCFGAILGEYICATGNAVAQS